MSNLIHGDCIEELKKLPDNSVDAIITDPPYFFGSIVKRFGDIDSAEAQWGNDGSFNRLSKGFMGKQWDGFSDLYEFQVFSKKWATECLRVLKPGAYLLSFGGTRTYHRMACGIEDAGFEIRDCIMWLYGSGFPKSLNIGKSIDKMNGTEYPKNKKISDNNSMSGGNYTRNTINIKDEQAKEWEGWGTALKPACEPIVVARKPLSEKNVALNVLKWGTGGINIDDCRISHKEPYKETNRKDTSGYKEFAKNCGSSSGLNPTNIASPNQLGRFPANIILDEEAGQMLDEQAGNKGALAPVKSGQKSWGGEIYHKFETSGDDGKTFYDNGKLGGASRFFYCAKASKSERNNGCEELPIKSAGGLQGRADGSLGGEPVTAHNNHPTVKPIALMEYLIKLVSRENAIVLDPFLGSGTTAIACLKLNRNFIGIEKDPEYIKIAEARIKPYLEQRKLLLEEKQDEDS